MVVHLRLPYSSDSSSLFETRTAGEMRHVMANVRYDPQCSAINVRRSPLRSMPNMARILADSHWTSRAGR